MFPFLALTLGAVFPTAHAADSPLEHADDVRAVYQIHGDHWRDEVGIGLHYLRKAQLAYASELGVPRDHRQLVAVLHGEAAYWLLNDAAWRRYREAGKGTPPEGVSDRKNPNADVVEALIADGARIEICSVTMARHGWTASDLLPGVEPIPAAYPRVIDLQQSGFAHILFD